MNNPYESKTPEADAAVIAVKETREEISDKDVLTLRKCSGYINWFGFWSIIWAMSQLRGLYRTFESMPVDEKTWQSIVVMLISCLPLWLCALGFFCAWRRPFLGRYLGMIICASWVLIFLPIFFQGKGSRIEPMHILFSLIYGAILIRSLIGFIRGKRLFGADRWTHSEIVSECNRRMIK